MRTPRSIRQAMFAVLGLALFAVTVPAFADDDPPDRVARLSFLRGDVSFQPSGDDEWVQANLNRPLGTGDKLYTDRDSRVEMEVGAATLRLDAGTSFDILNLDDNIAQTELSEGTMNLHVRRVFEGQSYEVDTPTLAFVITQPGDYRVDIAPDGSSTMVTVFSGRGDVYGENNASYSVAAGNAYRFHDASLQDYEVLDVPRGDEFDGWVDSRNHRYDSSPSRQYVSEEVIGYADLDDYGGWDDTPDYGHVWYPSNVEADWAPYRSGHWSWIDPWGWTWVDNASWGFAPFHYGRWVYVSNRWGWCPGPVHVRPIYAPALVAFVGGAGWGVSVSTGPVGWFPLGPRDVYVPWYHTSRNYFTNVNVRNTTVINNTYITNVYNNYSTGRPITNVNYAYRQNVNAVTAVPRDAFVGARAVNAARVQVNAYQLRNANVVSRVGITPQRASFVGAAPAARVQPQRAVATRNVIARTAPPARPVPVANRIETIQRNNGQPLQQSQLRRAAPAVAGAAAGAAAVSRNQPQHVQVVGQNARKPQPLPARAPGAGAAQAGNAPGRVQPNRGSAPTPAGTPNASTPNRANPQNAPNRGQGNTPERTQPNPPNRTAPATREQPAGANQGMPSSRFAPHGNAPSRTTGETPQRSTGNTPPRSTGNAPDRSTAPSRERSEPPQRTAPPSRNAAPNAQQERTAPATRSAPQSQPRPPASTRSAPPQERSSSQPQRNESPQRNASPPQRYESPQRNATPPQRSSPPPQQQQRYEAPQRSAPPPQRSSPPPQQQRYEAPQRSAPPPQQQRSAPPPQQQRSAPPPQQRAQPAERRPPPERKKDDRDDNGHRP